MNEEELICRYCKRKLFNIQHLGEAMMSIVSGYCKNCASEQCWYTNGKVLNWGFKVADRYVITYWPEAKRLRIEDIQAPKKSKSVFEFKVKEDPDYMTPDSMTEERIKTIIIFS